jgi:SAM-dependent methyltransferase
MTAAADADYILGHDDVERRRLQAQADFIDPLTRRSLISAGVRPGMRVLDVGAGFGDVTLLAAELVGVGGSVVGIERQPTAVATATARAAARGVSNVRFVTGDVRTDIPDEQFDAAIGRFVLMYIADPVEALTAVAESVRPGGIVAFQEWHAADAMTSSPVVDLWDRTGALLVATFGAAGTNLKMGLGMRACFEAAGLAEPELRAERLAGGGPSFGGYGFLAGLIRSVASAIERSGLATADELDVDTLEQRLREATCTEDATVALPTIVTAWSRVRVGR